jgi:hypothetical protein
MSQQSPDMEIVPQRYRDNSKLPPGDSVQDFWMRLIGLMLEMNQDTCALVLEMRDTLARMLATVLEERAKPGWAEPDGLLVIGLDKQTVANMMASLVSNPKWSVIAKEIIDGLKDKRPANMRTVVLIDTDQCWVGDIDPRKTAALLAEQEGILSERGSN